MTALPPSPFISYSADVVMPSTDTAAASSNPAGPHAAAVPISVSAGAASCSLPSGESEPSVMLAWAPAESLAFDPEEYTADDEALYQHLKRTVGELDDPPLFLRRYRALR